MTSIIWFRNDLRLADNPALAACLERGASVLPVFIWAPEEEAPWEPGGAARWWLHQSLRALQAKLGEFGIRLILRRGPTVRTLLNLARETGAGAVFWNRRYEPAIVARDQRVQENLRSAGLTTESFNGALLHEPWTIRNQIGRPFLVFTPFWKHCLTQPEPPAPLAAPRQIPAPATWPPSLELDDLGLEPKVNWTCGLQAAWHPGEDGGAANLRGFVKSQIDSYPGQRNYPGVAGTSRLSPHLHFGEITPRQIWHAVRRVSARRGLTSPGWRDAQFLTEIGWREFSHHLLYHFPRTPGEPLRENFLHFPWREDPKRLRAWQRGRTGYPIVDAGMRELWATGWMHNRVRMIAGSFLVKDLLVSWRKGARWFWDTLVDADLAQNTLGWQWTAGCGADAAPYFRIFNPVLQGKKFDPDGDYVRRWCPELAALPARWVHQPWTAPAAVLAASGIELGRNYPKPIIPHNIARHAALAALAQIKQRSTTPSA